MAFLDVSDILLDPDFAESSLSLYCERSTQTVGNNGRAVDSTTLQPFSGVVTNKDGDLLIRTDGGEQVKSSIVIHTSFRLQDGGTGTDADVVRWAGRRWTVTNIGNYSHFGSGFIAATCDLIPISG